MIDINLIPPALRKNGKSDANAVSINISKEILIGVGVGVVLLLAVIHLSLFAIGLSINGQLAKANAQWQNVLPDKNIFDATNKELGDLKNKINLISDITTKQSIRWAPKFNSISDGLPSGLWIRKMTLDKAGLTMEGSVVSRSQNEINNVGAFLASLKQDNDFIKDFTSLEVNSIQRGKNNTVEVTDFTVMAKLKQ